MAPVCTQVVILFLYSLLKGISTSEFNVTVSGVSTTTITLTWYLPQDMVNDIATYNLWIKYNRLTIRPDMDNKECSLLIGRCILRNLEPSTTYDVDIQLGRGNRTVGEHFKVATFPEQENVLHWWLIYLVAPSVGGVVLFILLILCCRICRCCCWNTRQLSDSAPKISNKSTIRLESHTTKQWIQDTVKSLPPYEVEGYDQPTINRSDQPRTRKEEYLPVDDPPVQPPAESKLAPTRSGSLRCGKPAPSSPPPCLPVLYANTSFQNLSPDLYVNSNAERETRSRQLDTSSDMYVNSNAAEPHTQRDTLNRQQDTSNAALYTNTEDMRSGRRVFPFL